MNSIADIPINYHLGKKYDKVNQKLSLPETEGVMNLFGQVSYCAQSTLAEASSAKFLFDKLGLELSTDIPTLRKTTTKFHKPTNGESICNLVSLELLKLRPDLTQFIFMSQSNQTILYYSHFGSRRFTGKT